MVARPVVCVRNTFIDFVREPVAEDLKRSQSEFCSQADVAAAERVWMPIAPPIMLPHSQSDTGSVEPVPVGVDVSDDDDDDAAEALPRSRTHLRRDVQTVEHSSCRSPAAPLAEDPHPHCVVPDAESWFVGDAGEEGDCEADGSDEGEAEDGGAEPASQVISIKNTFISVAEAPPAASLLQRAHSDMPRPSGAWDVEPGLVLRAGGRPDAEDSPPVPTLDRTPTIDGYEPLAVGTHEPWMSFDESPIGYDAGEAQMWAVAEQPAPLAPAQAQVPLGYVQAIMYVPVAVPFEMLQQQAWGVADVWQGQDQRASLEELAQMPMDQAAPATAPLEHRDAELQDVAQLPTHLVNFADCAADKIVALPREPSPQPLPPGVLGLERLSRVGCAVQRFRWCVDARKLRSSDRKAVSPAFAVHFSGPLQFRPVQFKLFIRPATVANSKGGSSFKKAKGRGILELNCLQLLDVHGPHPVQFRLAVGASAPRGPIYHDFASHTLSGLPAAQEQWDFGSEVDPQTDTFAIYLEVAAGADAERLVDFDRENAPFRS